MVKETFTFGLPEMEEQTMIVIVMAMLPVCGPSRLTLPPMTDRQQDMMSHALQLWLQLSAMARAH